MSKLVQIVNDAKAPFSMEIVKSIAKLCREDPYKLWHYIASTMFTSSLEQYSIQKLENRDLSSKSNSSKWKCSVCGKIFEDVTRLANHIIFYVRQKDQNHLELYKKIKEYADENNKTFTQAVEEIFKQNW